MAPRRTPRGIAASKRAALTQKKKHEVGKATVTLATALPARKSLTSSPPSPSKRTKSFGALWAGDFRSLADKDIKVHTLILGTHPSIVSLAENRYFDYPMK